MAVIPVICEKCGAVWFTTSLFGSPPKGTFTIAGCRTGPCPRCGGLGEIPDGLYGKAGMSLFSPQQFAIVSAALAAIQELLETNVQPAAIAKTIDEKYPFLAYLKKFIPNNLTELAIAVGILIALTKSCHPDAAQVPPADIQVKHEIADALRDIASRLPNAPPDIPIPPPQ
jgi:hypothetical protein